MRHRAVAEAAEVACRQSAKEEGRGLAVLIRVPVARRRVVPATTAARVDLVDLATSAGPVDLVVPATTVAPVDRAVLVDLVVQVTSVAPATTADRVVPATTAALVTSVAPAAQATSGSGLQTPSEASMVSHGATEQRRGAGEHPRGPDGAGRSLPRAECGTKGRSTIGASRNNPYGTGTKTVGASGSSESGSRCKQHAG